MPTTQTSAVNPMMSIIIGIVFYIIFAFPLYTMGQKVNSANPWFAFVPILNAVLMLEIAGKDIWWIILLFIPCINIVVLIIVWMAIAERMNKPSWWGIMVIVPIMDIIMPFYLAYG